MAATGRAFIYSDSTSLDTNVLMQQLSTIGASDPEYLVARTGPNMLVFTRTYLPTWAIVTGIICIPIFFLGLLLFLFRETETLAISAQPRTDGQFGSSITATGTASDAFLSELIPALNSLPRL